MKHRSWSLLIACLLCTGCRFIGATSVPASLPSEFPPAVQAVLPATTPSVVSLEMRELQATVAALQTTVGTLQGIPSSVPEPTSFPESQATEVAPDAPLVSFPASPTAILSDTASPTALPSVPPTSPPAPQPVAPVAAEVPPIAPSSAPSASREPGTFSYVFPVRVLDAQGRIWYGPCHHDYPATDIFAPVGSEFRAPLGGIVEFISRTDRWNPTTDAPEDRGGLAVAIIGDDHVRYYGSHLLSVSVSLAVGQRVQAGDVLGHVGQSGNARMTASHLHFGISHPTTPNDWETRRGEISPYTVLQAWQHGTQHTPDLTAARSGVC